MYVLNLTITMLIKITRKSYSSIELISMTELQILTFLIYSLKLTKKEENTFVSIGTLFCAIIRCVNCFFR